MKANTIEGSVFGIEFSRASMDDLIEDLRRDPLGNEALAVITANVDHVAKLRKDTAFREAYDNAWRVTVDGMPVFVYARLRGIDIRERVPGSDLVARFFERSSRPGFRYFFVAGSEATARAIRTMLIANGIDADAIASRVPPFGFHLDETYSRQLARKIWSHGTTHLFMGVGAPKSEVWVERHKHQLGGCYALCVGAGLDYFAAQKTRAPLAMQKLGLEWLWRIGAEPKRLTKRYVLGAVRFSQAVVRDLRLPHRIG